MTKHFLACLAYILPTFPLGYWWHLKIFQGHYQRLGVYREEMIIPLGLLSMVIQAVIFSYLYARLFAGLPVIEGALRFAALAAPLSLSFMVLAAAAKHHMTSPWGYILIESGFVLVHFLVVSPLIAFVYRAQP
jgi:hydrogenase-4 membrane subunit HyfE